MYGIQVDADDSPKYLTEAITTSLLSQSSTVTIPNSVAYLLKDLRAYLRDDCQPSIYCSDRRLVKITKLLRIIAITQHRHIVTPIDLLLLEHVLWNLPDDRLIIREYLWTGIASFPSKSLPSFTFYIQNIVREVQNINYEGWNDESGRRKLQLQLGQIVNDIDVIMQAMISECKELKYIISEFASLDPSHASTNTHSNTHTTPTHTSNNIHTKARTHTHMWLPEADLVSLRQQILPKFNEMLSIITSYLTDLTFLKSALNKAKLTGNSIVTVSEGESIREYIESVILHLSSMNKGESSQATYNDDNDSNNSNMFTAVELAYSKKEAQRKLSSDDFKQWKMAVKRGAGKKKGAATDDDNYDD